MKACPEVPIGALYHISQRLRDPSDASKGVIYEEEPADFATWFDRKVAGDSVNLRAEAVLRNPDLVRRARDTGKRVMAWLPCATNQGYEDGEELYRRLVGVGVDIICCNRPEILADVVRVAKTAAVGASLLRRKRRQGVHHAQRRRSAKQRRRQLC